MEAFFKKLPIIPLLWLAFQRSAFPSGTCPGTTLQRKQQVFEEDKSVLGGLILAALFQ